MPELYPEDQRRVDAYLNSNVHEVSREPFRGWRLLAVIAAVLTVLTLVSYWVAANHGVV